MRWRNGVTAVTADEPLNNSVADLVKQQAELSNQNTSVY